MAAKTPDLPADPFREIGLTMSGGGFRSACYQLGTLSYLHRLGILKNVTMTSSVSGGSFINAGYLISLADGVSFEDFFRTFHKKVRDSDMIAKSMVKFGHSNKQIPSGNDNLITSFAQVYHEYFFDKKRFGLFWDKEENIHVKDIIFNATELKTGTAFRFQKTTNPNAKIGNYFYNIAEDSARQLRIADIVAASSCFPGGFEPITMPHDFNWSDSHTNVPREVNDRIQAPLALIDGGVYDNQGIGSILLADRKKNNEVIPSDDFDEDRILKSADETSEEGKLSLLIISDSANRIYNLYDVPVKKKAGWLRVSIANNVLTALLLISIGLVTVWIGKFLYTYYLQDFVSGLCGCKTYEIEKVRGGRWYGFIRLLVKALPTLLVIALLLIGRYARKKVLTGVPGMGYESWNFFKKITVNQFSNYLNDRVGAFQVIINDVFLSRIRDLVYFTVYDENNKKYCGKRISNMIYDLLPNRIEERNRNAEKRELLRHLESPSAKLISVAESAAGMGTTLWFTKDDLFKQKDLEASGQFTTCFNILEYLLLNYKEHLEKKEGPYANVSRVYQLALSDWERFNENPYWMTEKLLKKDTVIGVDF